MKITIQQIGDELEKIYLLLGKFIDIQLLAKQAVAYHERLQSFESWMIVKAFRAWNEKKIPTVFDLIDKCKKMTEKSIINQKNYGALSDFVCQADEYFFRKNIAKTWQEDKLCKQKSIEHLQEELGFRPEFQECTTQRWQENLEFCRKYYGLNLCDWHQDVVETRKYPDGVRAMVVRKLIENLVGT